MNSWHPPPVQREQIAYMEVLKVDTPIKNDMRIGINSTGSSKIQLCAIYISGV